MKGDPSKSLMASNFAPRVCQLHYDRFTVGSVVRDGGSLKEIGFPDKYNAPLADNYWFVGILTRNTKHATLGLFTHI